MDAEIRTIFTNMESDHVADLCFKVAQYAQAQNDTEIAQWMDGLLDGQMRSQCSSLAPLVQAYVLAAPVLAAFMWLTTYGHRIELKWRNRNLRTRIDELRRNISG